MAIELWSKNEDEYGFIVESDNVKQRVYLENHMLLEGIAVSEIDVLNTLYIKELTKKKEGFDRVDFLIKLSINWFTITSCFNTYVELLDFIVFNFDTNKFESLVDSYSNCVEKYINSYDEDGNPVIVGEFGFDIRRKLDLEEELAIVVEVYYEEYLYRIKESESFLFIKSDLNTNISKGIIISKAAANSLMNNKSNRIFKEI